VKASWIALWGPSAIAWFVFEAAISLSAQWHHANIDLPDAVESKLRRLIVTPRFHAMHHMVDREFGDAHFSTIFSVWDPIFGSMARGQTRSSMKTVEIGLPEGRTLVASPKEWLLEPVRSRNLGLARNSRLGG
jgi:sterol desaturase/sphingolipid hydroxylase (fatty acid hydroxylase superfamily)